MLEVLRTKHVSVGGGCSLCSATLETIEHILCECPVACQVWGSNAILNGLSFVDFVKMELGNPNGDRGIRMAAIFWTLWKVRNDHVWNGKNWVLSMIKAHVDSLIFSWKQTYSSNMASNQGTTLSSYGSWLCPPQGRLKCNVDAALADDSVSFGAVIRDHAGKFVAACAGQMNCARYPYLAESMAVKEALTWLKRRNMANIIVESDCLNFCTNFNSLSADFSYIGLIIKQCRLIARDIGDTVVCHVKRSANHVAHVLARAGGSFPVLTEWDTVPSGCISDLILF